MKYNFLLECDDPTLTTDKINELIKENKFDNATISKYDLEVDELINALEDIDTYNFLSDKKVIIINNLFHDPKEKLLERLLKYLDNSIDTNLVILTTPKLDNRLNIVKKYKNNNNLTIVDIQVNPYDYIKNILNEYKIDNKSINSIIDLCKVDITRIYNECNKLMMYKLDDKKITLDDVNEMVVEKLGESNDILFSLIRYIIIKDKKNALETYNTLKKYNIDSNSIIGLMASQIKLIHQIKILTDDGLNNDEITKVLSLKSSYQVKKIKEYIYEYTYNDIYNLVEKIADIDYKVKSGKVAADNVIEILIFNL